ncbi:hypothetical protein JCM3770_004017 [Rhodotorula araucariae]
MDVLNIQWGGFTLFLGGHPGCLARTGCRSIPHYSRRISAKLQAVDKSVNLAGLPLPSSLFPHPAALTSATYRDISDAIITLYAAMIEKEQRDAWGISREARDAERERVHALRAAAERAEREVAEMKEREQARQVEQARLEALRMEHLRAQLIRSGMEPEEVKATLLSFAAVSVQV